MLSKTSNQQISNEKISNQQISITNPWSGKNINNTYIQVVKNITMYTGPLCNFCDAAKRLLLRNNLEFNEIDISTKSGLMDEMIKKANGKRTIPQIFFDDNHVGGYQELRALEKSGELKNLIK